MFSVSALRFLIYGLIGWCLEIIWTAVYDLLRSAVLTWRGRPPEDKWHLTGKTYLWMLPIYGAGGLLLENVYALVSVYPFWVRGGVYSLLCFSLEYTTGFILRNTIGRCPWDYSACWLHVNGLIRPDYAVAWAVLGLGFEWLMRVLFHLEPCLSRAVC